jgi:acyl carrier protein
MADISKEELFEGVVECVADSLAVEKDDLKETTLLITDLEADSLDIMDIMFQLEEKFEINLQKEDFNFLKRLDLSEEEGIVDGLLTKEALKRLKEWLPSLDTEKELKPADLGNYLSIASLMLMVKAS